MHSLDTIWHKQCGHKRKGPQFVNVPYTITKSWLVEIKARDSRQYLSIWVLVLSWQEWHLVWFSAVVGLTFKDALLHNFVLTNSYPSYCCFPMSLKQSGHSPLTSGIHEVFFQRTAAAHLIFSLFESFSVIPRNTQKTSTTGTNNHAVFKVT